MIESNKLMAEFLGYKQLEVYTEDIKMTSLRIEFEGRRVAGLVSYTKPENRESTIHKLWNQLDMKFDTDWNWLMQVVEKIEENNFVNINDNICRINSFKADNGFSIDRAGSTKIQAVYSACLQFIQNESNI